MSIDIIEVEVGSIDTHHFLWAKILEADYKYMFSDNEILLLCPRMCTIFCDR